MEASEVAYSAAVRAAFEALQTRLGIGADDPGEILRRIRNRRAQARGVSEELVQQKIEARTAARADKDFAAADGIRDELLSMGVELLDTPAGTDWRIS